MKNIEQKVFEIIRRVTGEDDIELSSNISYDLGMDSLDVVDVVVKLEDEFCTIISDEEIEEWRTVGDIVDLLEKIAI